MPNMFGCMYYVLLFIIGEPTPTTAWSARTNAKKGEKKERTREWEDGRKKRIEVQRSERRISISGIDALIGEEEQTGKRRENKEKNRERVSNPVLCIISEKSQFTY